MVPGFGYVRDGKGPFVIEVMTHRYREHCGPYIDDHLDYRDETFEKWKKFDILDLLKNDLINQVLKKVIFQKRRSNIKFIKNEYKNSEINYLKKEKNEQIDYERSI